MAYTPEQWIKAKGLFELGYSPEQIAHELNFKSRDTVYKRAVKEKWEKNKILQEKTELLDLEKKNSTIQQENSTMVEKLSNLEDYQITILKDITESELKRKSILLNTATLSMIRKNQMLTKNTKTVIEFETTYSDDGKPLMKRPIEFQIELSPNDLKAIDEGLDKNAVTAELAPRHSNSQINVNTQNNIQNNNTALTLEQAEKEALLLGVPLEVLVR